MAIPSDQNRPQGQLLGVGPVHSRRVGIGEGVDAPGKDPLQPGVTGKTVGRLEQRGLKFVQPLDGQKSANVPGRAGGRRAENRFGQRLLW